VEPDLVVDIGETFAVKMESIRAHRSQFGEFDGAKTTPLNRPGFLGVVEARALGAGYRIGALYGESFKLLRPIAVEDPERLF
jgi:LmbE family N-acetylglucosaminyl deacetylase